MGVWAFFEQYPRNCKGMRPSMVISNVSNDMLAKSSNIPRLLAYLNTVNAKMILRIPSGMRLFRRFL